MNRQNPAPQNPVPLIRVEQVQPPHSHSVQPTQPQNTTFHWLHSAWPVNDLLLVALEDNASETSQKKPMLALLHRSLPVAEDDLVAAWHQGQAIVRRLHLEPGRAVLLATDSRQLSVVVNSAQLSLLGRVIAYYQAAAEPGSTIPGQETPKAAALELIATFDPD